MGKFVGLVGAMTTVGAMAYLMAPLPQSATSTVDRPTPVAAARDATTPPARVATASEAQPAAPASRDRAPNLVQQIQAELQRVGCYDGAIDGQWSNATQRAMQTLGERVSVLRPVDTPDYIMLALARDQTGTICAATQRTAEADQRDRRATAATTEVTGKGAVRPTSAATRVAIPEPERPSASQSPRVWRAVPEASHKRAVARSVDSGVDSARLKAAREELSKRASVAATPLPADATDDAASPGQLPDANRMGLGVGPGDPLQAYTDPRNPNAPAILRAPPQPQPRVALQSGERPAVQEPAPAAAPPPPPATAAAPTPPPPARVARRESSRDWRRNVFNDMRFNGP